VVVTAGARLAFGTPYRWARMRHTVTRGAARDTHAYAARVRPPWPPHRSRVVVEVGGPREPDALDHFVSARWGLHTSVLGVPLYVPNHHAPWPLHEAAVVELDDELLSSHGFGDLAARPPDHVAFSPGVRTVFGLPRRLRSRR
jgi:uncharacterized protein YqjF (DUF2071 family)